DLGHSGAGGALTDTDTVSITVHAVNDDPTNNPDHGYINTGARVDNGQLVAITGEMLHEGDPDNGGEELTYTVSASTMNGWLFVDSNKNGELDSGEELGLNSAFTQQDIDSGLIKYQHGAGVNSTDLFAFSITDGEGWLIGET